MWRREHRGRVRRRPATLAALCTLPLLVTTSACAKITATSEVRIVETDEPTTTVASGREVVRRGYEADWVQLDDQLLVQLREHQLCREQLHVPVLRIEKIRRTAGRTLAWEYIIAGAMIGFASFAFASPQSFSSSYVDTEGTVITPTGPGYRTGGLFLGLGTIVAIAAVHDTVQARDSEIYADAYVLRPGNPVPCTNPVRPLAHHRVRLLVDDHESEGTTDAQGRVRLALPPWENEVEPATGRRKAAISVSDDRAIAVDYRVPYRVHEPGTLVHTGHANTGIEELD